MKQEVIETNKGPVKLEYSDGIAGRQLIDHLINKYGVGSDKAQIFVIRFIENAIAYAVRNHRGNKNHMAYYLHEVLPDVTFSEIVAYMENDELTDNAVREKYDFWGIMT